MEPAQKSYLYKLSQFAEAVNGFSQAITVEVKDKGAVEADLINNGKVQKFEYCVELAWKLARKFLFDIHGLERNSPKSAAKGLLEVQLIDDDLYQHLIEMLYDRNRLSHVYNMEDFSEILNKLKLHNEGLQTLCEKLREAQKTECILGLPDVSALAYYADHQQEIVSNIRENNQWVGAAIPSKLIRKSLGWKVFCHDAVSEHRDSSQLREI